MANHDSTKSVYPEPLTDSPVVDQLLWTLARIARQVAEREVAAHPSGDEAA
jgi:hypothetical protein